MQPFSCTLANGTGIDVVHKIYGRRRSIRLILFKIRRKQTLIAYTVQTQEQEPISYTIYKTKDNGTWQRGGISNQGRLTSTDKVRTKEIKTAIDLYESAIGPHAYRQLF